mmetsp:Transcript_100767/g.291360  ORF Transcript_100767/g.291360 Transcript_100767/m.291360 type:complete len:295 (-) Transcript_100767:175-1059(-)
MNGSKRALSMGEESAQSPSRPAKRARREGAMVSLNEVIPGDLSQGRFLRLHLQFLKMLYSKDDLAKNDDDIRDGQLDASIFRSIEGYLRDRNRVRSLDCQVQRCRDLFGDAVDYSQDSKEQSQRRLPISYPQNRYGSVSQHHSSGYSRFGTNGKSSIFGSSQQSPFIHSNRMNPFLHGHHNDTGGVGENSAMSPGWGLVTGILHAKYRNATKNLQRITTPLAPLMAVAKEEIRRLEAQTNGPESPAESGLREETSTEEERSSRRGGLAEEEDREARRLSKIRLWRLLLAELSNR